MEIRKELQQEVAKDLLLTSARLNGELYALAYEVPAQIYLSARHKAILFGDAPANTVRISGPKGEMKLPVASGDADQTRAELSYTEAMRIGIKGLPIWSGSPRRGADCILYGSDGKVTLDGDVYAPPRRLRLCPTCAEAYGLTGGERIWAKVKNDDRSLILGNVLVCVGKGDTPALYLDSDEACAAALTDGQVVQLLKTHP
ncbi:MAG: hypothetical protein FWE08_03275 [Oscillospiraceae bacterium]|nr:hypothetical protein [Oscillospiraceae bacterium]